MPNTPAHNRSQSKDWLQRRNAFLNGKSCEWCGSSENLVVAPKNPTPSYLARLREKTVVFLQSKVDAGEFKTEMIEADFCPNCGSRSMSHRKAKRPSCRCLNCRSEFDAPIHRTVSTGRLSREGWDVFWNKYSHEIKQLVMDERHKADDDYVRLYNCIVLCRRCHFARLRGLVLCPLCKTNYRRPNNETCWECFKKTERGKEVAKRFEPLAYMHPWCGKSFEIERQFWDLAADPEVCCLEICGLGPSKCTIAEKNWKEESHEQQ